MSARQIAQVHADARAYLRENFKEVAAAGGNEAVAEFAIIVLSTTNACTTVELGLDNTLRLLATVRQGLIEACQ
jgi:hypothetical protein